MITQSQVDKNLLRYSRLLAEAIQYRQEEISIDIPRCLQDPYRESHVCHRTNVPHVSDAQWTAFGEVHTSQDQRRLNADVANSIYSAARRDTFRLESNTHLFKDQRNRLGIPSGAICKSWDDIKVAEGTLEFLLEMTELLSKFFSKEEEITDYLQWRLEVQEFLERIREIHKKFDVDALALEVGKPITYPDFELFNNPELESIFVESKRYFNMLFIDVYFADIFNCSLLHVVKVVLDEANFNQRQECLINTVNDKPGNKKKRYYYCWTCSSNALVCH